MPLIFILLNAAVVYTPFLAGAFRLTTLNIFDCTVIIGFSIAQFAVNEICKLMRNLTTHC